MEEATQSEFLPSKLPLTVRYPQQATKLYLDVSALELIGYRSVETYKITHPYGVDEIIAEPADKDETEPNDPGEINYTEDIGAGQGFDGALNSRIGTFLKAVSPAPPPGYTGNPDVEQTVTGGVNGQNFFRIEGPGIGLIYPDYACGRTTVLKQTYFL